MQEEYDDVIELIEQLLGEVDGMHDIDTARRDRMQVMVYQLYDMIWGIRGGFTSESDTEEDTESVVEDIEEISPDDPIEF